MAKKKIKITAKVYPVTWSGDKILKYRAHFECSNGINIYGCPMNTKEQAKKYLDAANLFLQSQDVKFQEID